MKLIFESLNDYEIARMRVININENLGDKFNKGKKWISEQIKRMIALVKAFISKIVSKLKPSEMIEALNISKLKDPTLIYSPGFRPDNMLRHIIMQSGVGYEHDDSDEECIKKSFGTKKATSNEIKNDVKIVEKYLMDIDALNKRVNDVSETETINSIVVAFNTILKVMTGAVSEHVKTQSGFNVVPSKDIADIVNSCKNRERRYDISYLENRGKNYKKIRLETADGLVIIMDNPIFNKDALIKFANDSTEYVDIGPYEPNR